MAGFTALNTQADGSYTGKLATFSVAAAHASILAPGDVVRMTGTGDADGLLAQADALVDVDGQALGVIASIDPQFVGENLDTTGLAASTAGTIKVQMAPNTLFEVDVTGTAAPLEVTQIGLNAAVDVTAATVTGGLTVSNMAIDADVVPAATAAFPFRIVSLLPDAAGVVGNRAIVSLNNVTAAAGTTGV